jgi:O-antigen/teichoic acid export membrane protein
VAALDRAAKQVSALAITGQALAYLLAVILARRLGVEGFKAYVVASSTFILLVMLAPRGFDKFTLRLLPVLLDRGEFARSSACAHTLAAHNANVNAQLFQRATSFIEFS